MVDPSDGQTIVPPPEPPGSAGAWYAPDVRARYEPYPGVVATVSERPDAAGSQFRYETREPSLGPTGERAVAVGIQGGVRRRRRRRDLAGSLARGGITEVREITAMAEGYDVAVAPHCPLGPVALASCLQVDACSPDAFVQERSLDIHYNETSDVLECLVGSSVFAYEDGYVRIPESPSLEIDENHVRAQAEADVDWHDPVWRHADGSVAEW